MQKRCFLKTIAAGAVLACAATVATAQTYPSRPLKFIVPFPAGGISDTLARSLANHMSKTMGQPVVVENKAGAGGNLGLGAAVQAPPDGYTVVLGATSTVSVGPYLFKNLSFDARKDLAPVAMVGTIPNVLVINKNVPASNLKELVAWLKANPGKVNFASPGSGNSSHLAGEMFKQRVGVDIKHIPYKGDVPAITDLIGGQTQMMFATVGTALAHIQAGNLKPLAIAGPSRSTALPQVPTIGEEGIANFDTDAWFGVFAHAATPAPRIERLNLAINAALNDPEINSKLSGLGLRPVNMTVPVFTTYVKRESEKWGELVKTSGASLD